MITLIEALNYRSLKYVRQPLDRFHVLVGPNASGKTTFLEVVALIGRILSTGLEEAIREITPDPRDLLFGHTGDRFELALEAEIPAEKRKELSPAFDTIRYEISIGVDASTGQAQILNEVVRFTTHELPAPRQLALFPDVPVAPETIIGVRGKGTKWIVSKSEKDSFYPEVKLPGKGGGWLTSFKFGPLRSAFANLPGDESWFPVAVWFREFLTTGVQQIILDSLQMRRASPPGQARDFKTDGSNLPWVVEDLRKTNRSSFEDWIAHLQTALPGLTGIRTVEREDTRHRHIVLEYEGGLCVPSWTASDGTLRLLALTLPAYLPDLDGAFLIEEPENGIHPRAVDTMFQSLSNVYDAQILLATHSPVILSIAEAAQVLCFAKDAGGATDVVSGDEHPALVDWQRDTSLGVLFAAGVLGSLFQHGEISLFSLPTKIWRKLSKDCWSGLVPSGFVMFVRPYIVTLVAMAVAERTGSRF